jgi:hypothetical protein
VEGAGEDLEVEPTDLGVEFTFDVQGDLDRLGQQSANTRSDARGLRPIWGEMLSPLPTADASCPFRLAYVSRLHSGNNRKQSTYFDLLGAHPIFIMRRHASRKETSGSSADGCTVAPAVKPIAARCPELPPDRPSHCSTQTRTRDTGRYALHVAGHTEQSLPRR